MDLRAGNYSNVVLHICQNKLRAICLPHDELPGDYFEAAGIIILSCSRRFPVDYARAMSLIQWLTLAITANDDDLSVYTLRQRITTGADDLRAAKAQPD